jgi:hypothetical protein
VGSAWIAVIGTLGGVAVTALAGLGTAVLVGRQQQAVEQTRFRQETGQKIREERRTIFVEYLAAYDAALGRAHQVFNSSVPAAFDEVAEPRPFETVAETEMGRVNQAYLTITITALRETREAASECTGVLWEIGNAAMSGDRLAFNLAVENGREPRHTLQAAMRKELDVVDDTEILGDSAVAVTN